MKIKNLKFLVLIMILAGNLSCQDEKQDLPNEQDLQTETDFFYSRAGEEGGFSKIYFKIRTDKVILKCCSEAEAKELSQQSIFLSAYDVSYNWVIGTINPKKIKLDDLLQRTDVVSATYGLEYVDGSLSYPTDRISVKFKNGNTPGKVLDDIGLTECIESIALFDPYSEIYIVTLNVKLGDILRICRNLVESGLCECAEPTCFRELNIY